MCMLRQPYTRPRHQISVRDTTPLYCRGTPVQLASADTKIILKNKVCSSIWHARWRGKSDPHSIGGTIWTRSQWIGVSGSGSPLIPAILQLQPITTLHLGLADDIDGTG